MEMDVLKGIWPEWQIEKQLGRGSYGVVYKAVRRDHNVEDYAAIKVISIPSDASEIDSLRSEGLDMHATRTYLQGIVNDFVSEIQLMVSLKGIQNIVSVEDYKVVEKTGKIGWDIYIRMELLIPFNTYICDKKLTEEDVIKLGCDICTALEICSKRNIIHRDIKPENIFINDFGYFKLGDFGIARKLENMTGGLSQKGTYNYMAPEVANSTDYDARVDIYSLGIVLYRLLNGNRLPFLNTEKQLLNPNERRNAVDRRMRGEALPAPCDASPAMANLILRACAFDPSKRFASAAEMKQALMCVNSGTSQASDVDLDKTTSVRHAPADYDETISVRKAPAAPSPRAAQAVNTFGNSAKKRNDLPKIIAAVLAVVVLAGSGILAMSILDNSNGGDNTTTTKAADYSKFDEERIETILSEAEQLAAAEDYEGALTKVQTGLVTYPKSEALREKSEEYTAVLNTKVKETTLAEAAALAEAGDYLSAMDLIKNAQDTYGDDADYQNAYEMYHQAYIAQENEIAAETLPAQSTPAAVTTADLISDSSIEPLIAKALQMREDADAKWDHITEIPGECVYSGYIYMENPAIMDMNRIYLVFLMNATVKNVPIQFIYWVYFTDIAFDSQGNITYATLGSSKDDGYTVNTAFGPVYSYYGLDNYTMFDYYIISAESKYNIVKKEITELPIDHPVSDTYQ